MICIEQAMKILHFFTHNFPIKYTYSMFILAAVDINGALYVSLSSFGVDGFMKWVVRNTTAEKRFKMTIFKLFLLSNMSTTLYVLFLYSNNMDKLYIMGK